MKATYQLTGGWKLKMDTSDTDYPAKVHAPDDGDSVDYQTAIDTGYVRRISIPEVIIRQLEDLLDEVEQAVATARGYS